MTQTKQVEDDNKEEDSKEEEEDISTAEWMEEMSTIQITEEEVEYISAKEWKLKEENVDEK